MKNHNILLILFLFSLTLQSIESPKVFQQDNFYYKMNSFIGTDYFPERNYKSVNYFDRYSFYAGWKYSINQNLDVWLDLTFNDKFYEKEILLHKTGISYQRNNFLFSYKIDKIQYGENSKTHNIQVKDRFYDFGVIENYRYNGVEISFSKDNLQILTNIAANDFHFIIVNASIKYTNDSFITEAFYLYIGRNEEYNERNHSFGIETSVNFSKFSLYQSAVYQYLPSYTKGDKIKSLFEVTFSPFNFFSSGTSIFGESFSQEDILNWQSQSYLNFNFFNFKNYILYRINKSEEFTTNYTNIEYSLLSLYNFTDSFSLGLNYSFFTPDFDQDYHQIGFQIEFNYEKDI